MEVLRILCRWRPHIETILVFLFLLLPLMGFAAANVENVGSLAEGVLPAGLCLKMRDWMGNEEKCFAVRYEHGKLQIGTWFSEK